MTTEILGVHHVPLPPIPHHRPNEFSLVTKDQNHLVQGGGSSAPEHVREQGTTGNWQELLGSPEPS